MTLGAGMGVQRLSITKKAIFRFAQDDSRCGLSCASFSLKAPRLLFLSVYPFKNGFLLMF